MARRFRSGFFCLFCLRATHTNEAGSACVHEQRAIYIEAHLLRAGVAVAGSSCPTVTNRCDAWGAHLRAPACVPFIVQP